MFVIDNGGLLNSVGADFKEPKLKFVKKSDNKLCGVYPFDIVIDGESKLRYDGKKYQRFLIAWHKTIQLVCHYCNINDVEVDIGKYSVGFTFSKDYCDYVKLEKPDNRNCLMLNPSDLNFVSFSWRGIVSELLCRAINAISLANLAGKSRSEINMVCNWYIDDFYYVVGMVLKTNVGNLPDCVPFVGQ